MDRTTGAPGWHAQCLGAAWGSMSLAPPSCLFVLLINFKESLTLTHKSIEIRICRLTGDSPASCCKGPLVLVQLPASCHKGPLVLVWLTAPRSEGRVFLASYPSFTQSER